MRGKSGGERDVPDRDWASCLRDLSALLIVAWGVYFSFGSPLRASLKGT